MRSIYCQRTITRTTTEIYSYPLVLPSNPQVWPPFCVPSAAGSRWPEGFRWNCAQWWRDKGWTASVSYQARSQTPVKCKMLSEKSLSKEAIVQCLTFRWSTCIHMPCIHSSCNGAGFIFSSHLKLWMLSAYVLYPVTVSILWVKLKSNQAYHNTHILKTSGAATLKHTGRAFFHILHLWVYCATETW